MSTSTQAYTYPSTPTQHRLANSLASPSTSTADNTPIVTPHTSPSQICSSIFAMASSALYPRGSTRAESPSPSPVVCQASPDAGPSNHRRSRSREFWANLGFAGGLPKMQTREEVDDEPMDIDETDTSISLILPPSLPKCSLSAAFQCSDSNADIPPAFYPGQAIPTVLTFQLDRYSSLPHSLNPTLTMSLVGTLHVPNAPPRTIICVSVSLAEGLALWARDASQAYADRQGRENVPDVSMGLPGGTYSLPLTVQVPSTPRLPPSYSVAGASFAVTYALTVTLTCDDAHRPGSRLVLAEAARPFEMMPDTMPTRAPRFTPQSFYVRMDNEATPGAVGVKGAPRRPNFRWTVSPELPTTAFSPTSVIPLKLNLRPPPESTGQTYQVLVRISLLRREHSSLAQTPAAMLDPATQLALVSENEVSVRWGWVTCRDQEELNLEDIELPITLPGAQWQHGYSTHLNVGSANVNPSAGGEDSNISVSSTFHLCCTLAFLPVDNASAMSASASAATATIERYLPQSALDILPSSPGVFTPAESGSPFCSLPMSYLKRTWPGTIKTLPLPVIIGSVSEPRGAMHTTRWSDLVLERNTAAAGGGETGRMIHGEAISCEDGWVVPPPDYREACVKVPYIFG